MILKTRVIGTVMRTCNSIRATAALLLVSDFALKYLVHDLFGVLLYVACLSEILIGLVTVQVAPFKSTVH